LDPSATVISVEMIEVWKANKCRWGQTQNDEKNSDGMLYFKHISLFNKKQLDRTQVSQLWHVDRCA